MNQSDRMSFASNEWEADPWDAPDAVANMQLAGFRERAGRSVAWKRVHDATSSTFGVEKQKLIEAGVVYFASIAGEDMLLIQLDWHGFPNPPEWGLITRPSESSDTWRSWGHFAAIPEVWRLPVNGS